MNEKITYALYTEDGDEMLCREREWDEGVVDEAWMGGDNWKASENASGVFSGFIPGKVISEKKAESWKAKHPGGGMIPSWEL